MKRLIYLVMATLMVLGCKKDQGAADNGDKWTGFDFTASGLADGQEITGWTRDGVHLWFFYDTAKWYDNGNALRVYAGTSFILTSERLMTRIEFTFGEDDPGNPLELVQGEFEGNTWTGEAKKVVFSIGGQSGHRRISKMAITFSDKAVSAGTDAINVVFAGVNKDGGYKAWVDEGGTVTSAVYAGKTANYQNKAIQLNNTGESGIVSTASGGKVREVTVLWNDATAENRGLLIYGSNTPYESASDLYDSSKQGTLLKKIIYPYYSNIVSVTDDYEYIGFRAQDGVIYLNRLEIAWE
ncbi:MAG: hypothetical protein J5702_06250, partial [Bacteroidales bacterium]|nr:hypothetical protein [Bacteroidales bacterium]